MTTEKEPLEYTLVKLVVCLQTSLELFDDFKGTTIYRHDIKSGINNLSKKLEDHLGKIYHHIDGDQEKEETFMAIQRAVQQMVAMPIEEMYAIGEISSL